MGDPRLLAIRVVIGFCSLPCFAAAVWMYSSYAEVGWIRNDPSNLLLVGAIGVAIAGGFLLFMAFSRFE